MFLQELITPYQPSSPLRSADQQLLTPPSIKEYKKLKNGKGEDLLSTLLLSCGRIYHGLYDCALAWKLLNPVWKHIFSKTATNYDESMVNLWWMMRLSFGGGMCPCVCECGSRIEGDECYLMLQAWVPYWITTCSIICIFYDSYVFFYFPLRYLLIHISFFSHIFLSTYTYLL